MNSPQDHSEPTDKFSGPPDGTPQPNHTEPDQTSDLGLPMDTSRSLSGGDQEHQPLQSDPPDPESIDRFRILKRLGKGGFATVYLAQDSDLERQVALKVPRLDRFKDQSDLELFVEEARKVAQLEHPGIVRVLDVQRKPDLVYIVLPYLSGGDLSQFVRHSRLPFRRIAELMIAIADAVGFAHRRGYLHLDLKPSNILLDNSGNPCVADFGMALHESRRGDRVGQIFGTYHYMSPDQTRGEAHRLDGRTDIWSLGVIFYELLTGRLPFPGSTVDEIFAQIRHDDPKPPRQIDPEIPRELSRICLGCLAKRSLDRCQAAADLREDLLVWLNESVPVNESESTVNSRRASRPVQEASSPLSTSVIVQGNPQPAFASESSGEIRLVPQGLRSFGPEHSGFFLSLLPGPHDRDGLPRSLRFWKTRIEQTDADKTFPVGLVYGPSGCGKSSMVKAGLLSRLAPHVLPIYFEATGSDTETRLLKALRKHCPELPRVNDLPALFLQLRTDGGTRGRKVVIVIDQFEQWLHAHGRGDDLPLVNAFRQCDGAGVQAIVMVRDDFWMSATRFMQSLEIDLIENENSAAVDLFDRDHAIRVLGAFGQAYGRLSEHREEWSDSQWAFLRQAVDGLADDGRIVCVRLSLFAEMMKDRPWNLESLSEVGGTEGVGVTFLEESFGSRTAPPAHRYHQNGVRAILAALLPDEGTDIKGQMQSYTALCEASGYTQRPADFDALLRILDGQMRLITPTDSEGDSLNDVARDSSFDTRSYQLTHDFLVPSLREWLTRKQRETKRGRAELKLAERAAIWNVKRENKQLPTLIEWFQIRRWTDQYRWSVAEQSLMRTAAFVHARSLIRTFLMLVLVGALLGYGVREERLRSQRVRLADVLDSLQKTPGTAVPVNINKLIEMDQPVLIREELNRRYGETQEPAEKLSLAFALASFGQVEFDFLISQIDTIDDENTRNVVSALGVDVEGSVKHLKAAAGACVDEKLWRRQASLSLVALGIGDPSLAIEVCEVEGRVDHEPRTWFIKEYPRWRLDLNKVLQAIESSRSSGLRSAICIGLGSLDFDKVGRENKERISNALANWLTYPDSSTHNAAIWLGRKWSLSIPQVDDLHKKTAGRKWHVNSQGTTMVLIEPQGSTPEDVAEDSMISDKTPQPNRPYWLASCEVTRGEFEAFLADPKNVILKKNWKNLWSYETTSPTPSHPVQNIRVIDAFMYCNWLSDKEGRSPAYLKPSNEAEWDDENAIWTFDRSADGYRLPLDVEWEFACRAGSETHWSMGNDEEPFLKEYCQMNPSKTTEVCGVKLPNAWGLHDMHGNVFEWCWDASNESKQILRGGSWYRKATDCKSSSRSPNPAPGRSNERGFRLALSFLGEPD